LLMAWNSSVFFFVFFLFFPLNTLYHICLCLSDTLIKYQLTYIDALESSFTPFNNLP
jgi:hypothetical protein